MVGGGGERHRTVVMMAGANNQNHITLIGILYRPGKALPSIWRPHVETSQASLMRGGVLYKQCTRTMTLE